MGFYVHISVVHNANSDDIEKMKPIVEKHKKRINSYYCQEAEWFLDAVLDSKNYNCGPKGELFTWGIVGNYTNGEDFVEALSPFFEELMKKKISLHDHEHVLVFYEPEQREQATAFEIYLDENNRKKVLVKMHDLPFCWNQQ